MLYYMLNTFHSNALKNFIVLSFFKTKATLFIWIQLWMQYKAHFPVGKKTEIQDKLHFV